MLTEEHFIPFHASNLTGRKVLVLAPHPDDETLGCGGSLALHAEAGDPVRVVFLTNGAGGDISGKYNREAYIRLRREEALSACGCLGITDVVFWPYEDRALGIDDRLTVDLIGLIDAFEPALIYAPSPAEYHPDHRAASWSVEKALRACGADAELFFYEVNQPLSVSHLVDITPVLQKKIKALKCYQSQLAERPYDDVAIALNRFRSMTLPAGMTHAEAFQKAAFDGGLENEGTTEIWKAADRVDQSDPKHAEYGFAVIVRTQGIRNDLLSEALTSIASQSILCLAVVVVHATQDMLDSVMKICRSVAGLSYVVLNAGQTQKKRGYPLNEGIRYCLNCSISLGALAFLDDDDILYPEFSLRMRQVLRDKDADIVCAASNRRVPGQSAEKGYEPLPVLNLLSCNFIPINSYAIRFAGFRKTPVFFDESFDVLEDWHFLLKLLENGFRFEMIADTLSEFRIISDGNRPVKNHPELWREAERRIQSYIRDRMFRLDGRMLQSLWRDEKAEKDLLQQEILRLQAEINTMRATQETMRA